LTSGGKYNVWFEFPGYFYYFLSNSIWLVPNDHFLDNTGGVPGQGPVALPSHMTERAHLMAHLDKGLFNIVLKTVFSTKSRDKNTHL
jgi:hypothetical protein